MNRLELAVLIPTILVAAVIGPVAATGAVVMAQDGNAGHSHGIAEAATNISGQDTDVNNLVFAELKMETFLRPDGSAVLYIGNLIRNDSSQPMENHTWCFYWGQDVYSNVFAEDGSGHLDAHYYEDYSDDFDQWGLCVDVPFREEIEYGEQYWHAVSIVIGGHHTVNNDVIDAEWSVRSSSSLESYTAKASWPHNHEGVVADPEPDVLENSYAQWTRTNAQAPWQFDVDLVITLGDQMAVEAMSQGTFPFNGNDIEWEENVYGVNTGMTIGDWGCALTSWAMAMDYYAGVLGFLHRIDPGDLNTWLKHPTSGDNQAPRGYGLNGEDPGVYSFVLPGMMDDASQDLFDATGPVIVPGNPERLTGVAGMRDELLEGRLGVLNVDNGGHGHFVLVTGYTTVSGVETVLINDPCESRGRTTLLAQYNNQHMGNIRWSRRGDETVRPRYVELQARCPVALLVTDEEGRRTGYDPRTGQSFEEIPNSAYVTVYYPDDEVATDEGTKILQIESYEESRFRVDVIGTGTGDYAIDYTADVGSGVSSGGTYFGSTTQDQVDTLHLAYDPDGELSLNSTFLPIIQK